MESLANGESLRGEADLNAESKHALDALRNNYPLLSVSNRHLNYLSNNPPNGNVALSNLPNLSRDKASKDCLTPPKLASPLITQW